MCKQVNVTTNRDGEAYAWISNYSQDGYVGVLEDTVYADWGCDTTHWCIFAGSEGRCLIFRGLYNIYGEKTALNWVEREYKRWCRKFDGKPMYTGPIEPF